MSCRERAFRWLNNLCYSIPSVSSSCCVLVSMYACCHAVHFQPLHSKQFMVMVKPEAAHTKADLSSSTWIPCVSFCLRHRHPLTKIAVSTAIAHYFEHNIGLLHDFLSKATRCPCVYGTKRRSTCIIFYVLVDNLMDYICFQVYKTRYDESTFIGNTPDSMLINEIPVKNIIILVGTFFSSRIAILIL